VIEPDGFEAVQLVKAVRAASEPLAKFM